MHLPASNISACIGPDDTNETSVELEFPRMFRLRVWFSKISTNHLQVGKESLFYLTTPLEHIDFCIIAYWTSSI